MMFDDVSFSRNGKVMFSYDVAANHTYEKLADRIPEGVKIIVTHYRVILTDDRKYLVFYRMCFDPKSIDKYIRLFYESSDTTVAEIDCSMPLEFHAEHTWNPGIVIKEFKNAAVKIISARGEKSKLVNLPEPPKNAVLIGKDPKNGEPVWIQFGKNKFIITRGIYWLAEDAEDTDTEFFSWAVTEDKIRGRIAVPGIELFLDYFEVNFRLPAKNYLNSKLPRWRGDPPGFVKVELPDGRIIHVPETMSPHPELRGHKPTVYDSNEDFVESKLPFINLKRVPKNAALISTNPPTWLQFGNGRFIKTTGIYWLLDSMEETEEEYYSWHRIKECYWRVKIFSREFIFDECNGTIIGGYTTIRRENGKIIETLDGHTVELDERLFTTFVKVNEIYVPAAWLSKTLQDFIFS